MREKIVLGIVSFIAVATFGLVVLIAGIPPVQLKRQTFSYQINEPLKTTADYYVNANDKVLADCQVILDDVNPNIMAIYPASIVYHGQKFDFQISIEDLKLPVITLKEKSVVVAFVGDKFTASEMVDVQDDTETTVFFMDNSGKETASVSFEKDGSYDYYIVAEDSSKNRSQKLRVRFEVGHDHAKPALSGVTPKTIMVGDHFDPMEGVSAVDNADGDITHKIIVSGSVNTERIGQYELTYSVTDSNGNEAVENRWITVQQSGVSGQTDVWNGPFLTTDQINQRDAMVGSLLDSELDAFDDELFLTKLNAYLMAHFKPSKDKNDNSSYSVIVKERGNRVAMARAVKVILDKRGIENVIVEGDQEGMVWNIVKVDNKYRHLDVYANAISVDGKACFLLQTSKLDKAYAYDKTQYPNCD